MSSSAATQPMVHMQLLEAGVARISLAGEWGLRTGHYPDSDVVCDRLRKKAHLVTKVECIGTEIRSWDALLVAFLYQLRECCASIDRECVWQEMPEGVEPMLQGLAAQQTAATVETHATEDESLTAWQRRKKRWMLAWDALLERWGKIGFACKSASERVLDYIGELMLSLKRWVRQEAYFRQEDFVQALAACGPQALPIVTLISFLVGMTLAFVGLMQLKEFGADIFVANMVVIAMAREMGAMMTAIIMAGRTASSYAARLGTMVVNQEVDALETTGIKPMDFLVLPRVLALVVMMPWLTIYSIAVGIAGGALIAITMRDLTVVGYWNQTIEAANAHDFYAGFIKSAVFGVVVAMAGCYHGLRCGRSSEAVGQVTTAAVVSSIVYIIFWDSLLTVVYDITDF